MSKYTFKKIDDDTTELSYKDKKFTIKRDVQLQRDAQNVYNQARLNLMADLTKIGKTKQDFIIVKEENGKKYYDNSNYLALEEDYVKNAGVELYQLISKRFFNMTIEELIADMDLDTDDQVKFGIDLGLAIRGEDKTPSQEETK